jgi:hypothetical protein
MMMLDCWLSGHPADVVIGNVCGSAQRLFFAVVQKPLSPGFS